MTLNLDQTLLSTKDASALSGYNADYLSRLCRSGKIAGTQIGRTWLVNRASLEQFVREQEDRKQQISSELSQTREKEYQQAQKIRTTHAEKTTARSVRSVQSPFTSLVRTPAVAFVLSVLIMGTSAYAALGPVANVMEHAGALASAAQQTLTGSANEPRLRIASNVSAARTTNSVATAQSVRPLKPSIDGAAIASRLARIDTPLARGDTDSFRILAYDAATQNVAALNASRAQDERAFGRFMDSDEPLSARIIDGVVGFGFVERDIVATVLDSYSISLNRAGDTSLAFAANMRDIVRRSPDVSLALLNGYSDAMYGWVDGSQMLALDTANTEIATGPVAIAIADDTQQQTQALALAAQHAVDGSLATTHGAASLAFAAVPHALPQQFLTAEATTAPSQIIASAVTFSPFDGSTFLNQGRHIAVSTYTWVHGFAQSARTAYTQVLAYFHSSSNLAVVPLPPAVTIPGGPLDAPQAPAFDTGYAYASGTTTHVTNITNYITGSSSAGVTKAMLDQAIDAAIQSVSGNSGGNTIVQNTTSSGFAGGALSATTGDFSSDVHIAGALTLDGTLHSSGAISAPFFTATSLAATSTLPNIISNSFSIGGDTITDFTGSGLAVVNGVLTATASTSNPNTYVQGGNAFGTAATLGTTDGNALSFITNNIARMTIDAAGDVGISTTTSASLLSVGGDVRANTFTAAGTGTSTLPRIVTSALALGNDYVTGFTGNGLAIIGGVLGLDANNNYFSTTSSNFWLGTKSTSDLAEGSNLYFTPARADARINATSTIGTLISAPNLGTVATTLTGILKATSGVLSNAIAGTDYLAPASLSAAYPLSYNPLTGIFATAFSTTTANTFSAFNTFNGGVVIGSLNGPLQANNGVVSATSSIGVLYGGTGLTAAPAFGQILVGNALSGYTLTATSSLGLESALTFSAPLSRTGNTISIPQANGSTNGFLASADFALFNNKISSTSLSAGTGISYNSSTGVIANTGVTSNVAGTGISVSGATGAVTISNTGLLSLAQSSGSAQTGAITFATSSVTNNGVTLGLNITNSTGTFTFTPTRSGTLTVAGGGTGSTTLTGLLKGNGTGSLLTALAGTDYQAPITATYPIQFSSNVLSLAFGTTTANSWSALQTFNGGASTTQISAATGFFNSILATSTTATSTFAGGLSVQGGALTVLQNGKVGIGNTSPSAALDIMGTTRVSSTFTISAVASCIGSQALQTNASGDVSCGTIATGGASSGGGWTTNNNGVVALSTTTDQVVVGASTTPYAKLTVLSGSTATTTLALFPASSQTANILDIYNTNGALASVIKASGFLGLGTTSPSQQLSVQGNALFSGNLSTAGLTATGTVTFSGLGTGLVKSTAGVLSIASAGTDFLAPSSLSATYPIQYNSGTGVFSTAFGTTTANTFSALNTFNGGVTIGALNGVLHGTSGVVSASNVLLGSEVSGVLPVVNGGTGWAAIASGAIPYGNGSGALSTTTAGTNGQTLALANGIPTWVATTTFSSGLAYSAGNVTNTGLLSLTQNGGGSAQTGAITFATSSVTNNGVTLGLNITNSTGTFTFTPTRSGTLNVAGGGTGLASVADGTLLFGSGGTTLSTLATSTGGKILQLDFTTGRPSWVATSTLGLITSAITAIGPAGQLQTGPTITYATSTSATTGLTTGITVTGSGNTITYAPTLSGTLNVANGGTGSTTLSGLLKGNGTSGIVTAIGGTDYEFPLTFSTGLNRTGNTITNTGVLAVGPTGQTTNGTAIFATSTTGTDFTITGSGSTITFNLPSASATNRGLLTSADWNTFNNKISSTSLSAGTGISYNSATGVIANTGLLSLTQNGGGSAQTGAITFATSSVTNNGVTLGLNITNSTGTFTFTPTRTGTLTVAGGGTGSTTLTGLLKGNGTGAVATALAGTDYEVPLTFSAPLSRTANTISIPAANGSTNGYLASADWTTFNNKISSTSLSATYPLAYNSATGVFTTAFGTTTANTFSALNTFNGGISASTIVTTGSITTGTQFFGLSSDGASAPSFSWTGDITTGTFHAAANTIGFSTAGIERARIDASGFLGIGTSSPSAKLSVEGNALIHGTATIDGLGTGLVKATGGLLSLAVAGTDYQAPLTATYPVQISSNIVSLAFGTTTSNTWAGTQTFTNSPTFSTLGAGVVNATSAGKVYNTATSTETLGGEFAYSGTLGQFVSGVSGTLTLATNGTALTKIAQIAANTILGNNTGATGNVVAFATSTLGIALSDTTGTLAVNRGGTGSTTLSGLLKGNGTSGIVSAVAGTDYSAPLTFSYPLVNTANTISLAFGTTTANTWSALQTFNGGVSASTIVTTGSITTGTQFLGLSSDGANAPSFSWTGDVTSGIFHGGANVIGFSTSGIERARIDASGFLGIGTTTPSSMLSVAGDAYATGFLDTNSGFQINGTLFGYASSTNGATIIGLGAGGQNATTTSANAHTTAIGFQALSANTGLSNTAVGYQALLANTSGQANSALGSGSLAANISGNGNSALGVSSMNLNTTGSDNVAIGRQASFDNRSATSTVAIGSFAASGGAPFSAQGYTIVGMNAGENILTGADYNTLLGFQSGAAISSGYGNTLIGPEDGSVFSAANLTTGHGNIALGYDTFFPTNATNNALNVGGLLFGTLPATTTSFKLPTSGSIGIGTSSPYAKLSIGTNNGDTATTLFAIGSSTASATTTLFSIDNTGIITSNAAATSTFSSGLNVAELNITGSATSTAANGINIAAGCFAVNGTCLGAGSGTVTSVNASGGTTGLSFSGGPVTSTGTLTLAGTLGVANGGTGSTTLTGLLKGNGTSGIVTAIAGTDYEVPLTFSTGLNRSTNTITNTGVLAVGPTGQTTNGTAIFATSTTGTDFTITGSGSTITFNLPFASAANTGKLSSADWATFNNKISSTSLSAGTGISYNSATGVIANTGLLSLTQNGGGSAQTGAITFATSSATLNGQTHGLNITNSTGTFTFTPTLAGTLNVAGGGTGISSVADGSLLYGSGGTALNTLATSTGGKILQLDFSTGRPSWVATSTLGLLTAAIQSIGPAGQLQTGPTVTYATSTSATTGLTTGITITGSGNTITYAPTLSGTLNVANGGTGSTTLAGILVGNGTSGVNTLALPSFLTLTGSTLSLNTLGITNGGTGTTTQITNGVNYFDGTKITSNANFTFDGSNLSIPTNGWLATGGSLFAYASSTNGATLLGIGSGGKSATTSASLSGTTAIGFQALNGLLAGDNFNTAIGYQALMAATSSGGSDTAIGYKALKGSSVLGYSGSSNTVVGSFALDNDTTGFNNNAFGSAALNANTTGSNNIAIGEQALFTSTTGSQDIAIGTGTLGGTPGDNNTIVGYNAGFAGASNTGLGVRALSTAIADSNVGIGYQSLQNITSGFSNIGVGRSSLFNVTSGSGNVAIGNITWLPTASTNNFLDIGNLIFGALPATTSAFMLPTSGAIGIGTSSPYAKLSIATNNGDTATTLFAIGSSTASATTTLFSIDNTGIITSNAAATSTFLSGLNVAELNITGAASSTAANGINITAGCFAVNGACISSGASGTVTSVNASGGTTGLSFSGGPVTSTGTLTLAGTLGVANGGTATTTFYSGGVIFSDGTKLTQASNSGNGTFFWDNTNNRLGLGTTSPWAQLSINPNGITGAAFAIGSSTATKFIVTNGGLVGIGSTTPSADLAITGTPNNPFILNVIGTVPTTAVGGSAINLQAGAGRNSITSATVGGAVTISAGSGGNNLDTGPGASGGIFSLAGGLGGSSTDTNGGNGGSIFLYGGSGGVGASSKAPDGNTLLGITPTGTVVGRTGIATTSPYATLSIHAAAGTINTTLFAIGSSTASATTTLFSIDNTGIITSNAAATSTFLSGLNVAELNITGSATSTAANGINITAGCFAVNGACISTSGSGTVTSVNASGGTTGLSFSGGPVTSSGTLTLAGTLGITNGGTGTTTGGVTNGVEYYNGTTLTNGTGLTFDGTSLGIGSTTPWAQLSLNPNGISGPAFAIGSSTRTYFSIGNGGIIDLNPSGFGTAQASTTLITLGGQKFISADNGTSFGNLSVGLTALKTVTDNGTLNFGWGNTAIGFSVLHDVSYGLENTAVGTFALGSTTGSTTADAGNRNSALGFGAFVKNTSGTDNAGLGFEAGLQNTTGLRNIAIGTFGLGTNITGSDNIGIGFEALEGGNGTNGTSNVGIGSQALFNSSTTQSTALGYFAGHGFNNFSNTGSVYVGYQTGNKLSGNGSDYNSFIGYQAGYITTTGADNILLGAQLNTSGAGYVTSGSNNIGIGFNTLFPSATASNQFNLGNFLFGTLPATTSATSLALPTSGKFGIGTSSPYAKLSIQTNNGDTATTLFAIGSSTASATTTLFSIDNTGIITSNAAATSTFLSGLNVAELNITGSATSTAANGINLASGCFAVNGICISAGTPFSNTLAGGGTGTTTFYAGGVVFSDGSKLTQATGSGASIFDWDNTNGRLGIGTSTPGSALSVAGNSYTSGFINTNGTTGGYQIDGVTILQASSSVNSIALGSDVFAAPITGLNNVGIGAAFTSAGATAGNGNTGIGAGAFEGGRVNGNNNIGLGTNNFGGGNTDGTDNIAIGSNIYQNGDVLGNGNIGIGGNSLQSGSLNNANTAIGYKSNGQGGTFSFNSGNTLLGAFTDVGLNGISSSTAIGVGALVSSNNSLVLGGFGANSALVGIGTSSPYARLSIQANPNDTVSNRTLFAIGSSTASATTTLFSINNSGVVGIGTTSPTTLFGGLFASAGPIYIGGASTTATSTIEGNLSVRGTLKVGANSTYITENGINNSGLTGTSFDITTPVGKALSVSYTGFGTTTLLGLNINGSATSTSNVGFNITGGCFAVNGACISSGASGTVTSVDASGGTTGLSFSGGPVTNSGTLTLAGTLGVANGGTGSTTLTGLLKGNGTGGILTAVGDTDYQKPITLTTTGTSGAATFSGDVLNIPQYAGTTYTGTYPVQVSGSVISLAFGTTTANAWSGLQTFGAGFISQASSTIAGAFNVAGTSYFNGNVGIGTSTPDRSLSVGAGTGNIIGTNIQIANNQNGAAGIAVHNSTSGNEAALFAGAAGDTSVGSVSNSAFKIQTNNTEVARFTTGGFFGVGTTSPGSLLSLGGIANFTTATSTFYSSGGINITGGCFAVNGSCVGAGSFSNNLASGGTATSSFYAGGVVFSDGTKLTQAAGSGASIFDWDNTDGFLGIGTSTPFAPLSVAGQIAGSNFTATSPSATSSIASNLTIGTANPNYFTTAPLVLTTNTNSYGQLVLQNLNNGTTASSDFIVGGNLMTNSTYYGDLGYNSSGNADPSYTAFGPNDLYLYNSDGNLDLAAASSTGPSSVQFFTGGSLAANLRAEITSTGNFGIGTTTPGSLLSLGGIANFTTATSTFYGSGGINLTNGCFAVNGVCLSTGSTFTNTLANGGTATTTFYAGGVVFSDGTRLTQAPNLGVNSFFWDNTNNRLGIGTTSPAWNLSVQGATGAHIKTTTDITDAFGVENAEGTTTFQADTLDTANSIFSVATSTGTTYFSVGSSGSIGISSTSPWAQLSVNANDVIGPEFAIGSSTATNFVVNNAGSVGIGTSSPWGQLSVNPNGVTGPEFVIGSSTATKFIVNNAGNVGIGSTSPWAQFSVNPNAIGTGPEFAIGSSTATNFVVNNAGNVGIGTSSPASLLSVGGNVIIGASAAGGTNGTLTYGGVTLANSVTGTGSLALSISPTFTGTVGAAGLTGTGTLIYPTIEGGAAGTNTLVLRGGGAAPTTAALTFGAGSVEQARFTAIGFGIGTTTPEWSLQIASSSKPQLALSDGTITSNIWTIRSLTNSLFFSTSSPSTFATTSLASLVIGPNGGIYTSGTTGGDKGQGTINVTTAFAANVQLTSDARLKTNVQTLDANNGLGLIEQLNPVSFNWINPSMGTNTNLGFIAQQVQQLAPELVDVGNDPDHTLTLNYIGLISPIVRSIQQLDARTALIASSTATSTTQLTVAQVNAPLANLDAITTKSLAINGNAFATRFVAPATPITFTIASTTGVLPNEVLADDGSGVDLYRAATYAITGVQSLAAQTATLSSRIDSVELRVTMLEAIASSTPAAGGSLSLAGLEDLLGQIGVVVKNGIAHFTSLAFTNLIAAPASDGTSAVATSTIPMGDTQAVVINNLAHPTSEIFVTITSPLNGSWYISQKGEGSFTINLSSPQTADVTFDYFIVQTEKADGTQIAGAAASNAGQISVGITSAPTASTTPDASSTPASAAANAPTITLTGDAAVDIAQGAFWTDPGATAHDAAGNDLTSQIAVTGSVDTNTAGLYTLNYSVVDSTGASAGVSRIVHVSAPAVASTPPPSPPADTTTAPDSSTPSPTVSDAPAAPTGG